MLPTTASQANHGSSTQTARQQRAVKMMTEQHLLKSLLDRPGCIRGGPLYAMQCVPGVCVNLNMPSSRLFRLQCFHNILHNPKISHEWFKVGLA
jgi:hypothetical protein